jgi:two-component system, sensor histidine kinase ChiS
MALAQARSFLLHVPRLPAPPRMTSVAQGPQLMAGVSALDERWINQMFAGTNHNIGNMVQVSRLTLQELSDQCAPEQQALLDLVLNELLPALERHAAAGTLNDFVAHHESGKEYLGALRQAITHQRQSLDRQYDRVQALAAKLTHISDILMLQQRLLTGKGLAQEVTVAELLANTRQLLHESCARHRITVHWPTQAEMRLMGDPTMLTQVLVNLLKNAIEALDSLAEERRVVRLECQECQRDQQTFVKITIADQGHGIASEHLAQLGQPGFTTKGSDGTLRGLGLTFCRAALGRHGGLLDIQSVPEQGACFTVYLPVATTVARPGGHHG